MEYIPDKKLYSAVMFALRMCPSLRDASSRKIHIAANYYCVEYSTVLSIVQKELYARATQEAKRQSDRWYTVLNYDTDVLGMGIGSNYLFICPQCGARYASNIDSIETDKLFLSQCRKCGFYDEDQRNITRKALFDWFMQKGGLDASP